jgi:hypothetical protein
MKLLSWFQGFKRSSADRLGGIPHVPFLVEPFEPSCMNSSHTIKQICHNLPKPPLVTQHEPVGIRFLKTYPAYDTPAAPQSQYLRSLQPQPAGWILDRRHGFPRNMDMNWTWYIFFQWESQLALPGPLAIQPGTAIEPPIKVFSSTFSTYVW